MATTDDPLDDFPVDPSTVHRDLRLAQRAVVVHTAEEWPTGTFCVNCHDRYPCVLRRWGLAVLHAAGWTEADIAELTRRAAAGEMP
jgi:hypothetical protein